MKKKLSLGYFPGGYDKQTDSLAKCLEFINENNPSEKQFNEWFLKTFSSVKTLAVVKTCIRIMKNLELITMRGNKFYASEKAMEFLRTRNNGVIYETLKANYDGIEDILKTISENSRTLDEIYAILKEKIGAKWETTTQVLIRLNWLVSLGLVRKFGRSYSLIKKTKHVETETKQKRPTHSEMQDMIVEIGKFYGSETIKEYRLNGHLLDVLWKKKGQSVAWEVHFDANIHEALSKLKQAFDWIPAEPRLVTTEEGELEAKNLLETTFDDLKGVLKISHWKDIVRLYNSEKASTIVLEKTLGFKRVIRFRKKARRQ